MKKVIDNLSIELKKKEDEIEKFIKINKLENFIRTNKIEKYEIENKEIGNSSGLKA